MTFISLVFLAFLAVVLSVYWAMKSDRWRHGWLLLANFVFYGWWDWRFTALLALVILIAYGAALFMREPRDPRSGRWALAIGCCLLVGLLGYFKYFGFFMDSVQKTAAALGFQFGWTATHIILPVGISFYIFQGISYIVTVYQGRLVAERNLVKVGVYLSFFPHLVAGPIIHAGYFMPQLTSPRLLDSRQFIEGGRLFLWGLIYKAVFADNIGLFVDVVFDHPLAWSSSVLFAGCLGFYGQIYFDFAGYSLMAIGVANLLGYTLPENFRFPYRATSIIDFWRRWHISLSTWLRDYIYIPLGGSRLGFSRQCGNIMATMLIGGLWHGASWKFLLWGGLHGAALCLNHFWRRLRDGQPPPFFLAVTGFVLTQAVVFLLWIPFRAKTLEDVRVILERLLFWDLGKNIHPIPWLLLLVPLLVDTGIVGSQCERPRRVVQSPALLYAALVLAAIVALLFMCIGDTNFIYFQF